MRLANGIVIDKEKTFGVLKFSALRREVHVQNEDGSVSECYVALRSQRTNHVLHYEYTSTGENLPFLEEEYEIATENGVFQMNGRWSDNPIVL